MLTKQDYYFTYKYVLRFLLAQQYGFFLNTYNVPTLDRLLLYFSINELEYLDDYRTFNYHYLFRFFFGQKCFFTRFDSFFRLNRTFFNFNVQVFLKKRICFFPLFLLVNDLLVFTSNSYLKLFFMPLSQNGCLFYLRFFDLNLFLEKKTNAGLYYLVNNLNFKFFFRDCT